MDGNQKHFEEWALYQAKLEASNHKPPLFNEGEIWWCHVGDNIGTELCGKGPRFARPVLIIRKVDRRSFIGILLIGRSKKGSWYHRLSINDGFSSALLIQINYYDYKRLDKIISTILPGELDIVRKKFVEFILKT